MIVISKNISLSKEDTLTLNNPIVGFNSVVQIDNITASSEDITGNFPATNLANPATYNSWKAANGDAQTLTIIPGNVEVEFVGIARHNLGDVQSAIKIVASSGATDDDGDFIYDIELAPERMFGDNEPKILRFTRGTYVAIQVQLAMTSDDETPVQIAVLYIGELLTFQRRLYVGHTPLSFGDVTAYATSSSENGQYLGRLITSSMKQTAVSIKNLTPDWYRDKFRPFQKAAKDAPFFFAWRPLDYPKEVGYCWVSGDPKMTNALTNGMVAVDFSIGGIGDLTT